MAFLFRDLRVRRQTEVREISLGKIGYFQGSLRIECTFGGTHIYLSVPYRMYCFVIRGVLREKKPLGAFQACLLVVLLRLVSA